MAKIRNSARIWVLVLAAVATVMPVEKVWAEYGFTAYIDVREEYNDNIFLAPDKTSDFITTINPGLTLSYKKEPIELSLDYGLQFRFYARNSDQNQTSVTNAQRAKLDTTINVYKDIVFLRISDLYQRVPIDNRKPVALDNYIVNMTDSNTLIVNPYIQYPLGSRTTVKLSYAYTNQWYNDNNLDPEVQIPPASYQQHEALVSLSQELLQTLTATVSYSYRKLLYYGAQEFSNYNDQTAKLALDYQVTPKLLLNGMIGYTWYVFDNPGNLNIPALNEFNVNDPIWNVGAQYQATERITIGARYYQDFSQSVNQGVYKTNGITGYLNYAGKVPSTLSIYTHTDTYALSKNKYTGGSVDFTLPFSPKLNGHLRGFYENYDYSPSINLLSGENGNRYGAGLSFGYDFRITTVTLGYVYNRNNSSIPGNDYNNNIIWIEARFAYSI